jgi:hypothetical protein
VMMESEAAIELRQFSRKRQSRFEKARGQWRITKQINTQYKKRPRD